MSRGVFFLKRISRRCCGYRDFFDEVALDLVTRQGTRLPVLVNARERRDASGRHLFTRLTIFNATDRRRYERQFLEARVAAEASEKELERLRSTDTALLLDERATAVLREQFIAVLGHDLRNPLAAIVGAMDLLLKTPLNDRAKHLVGMTQASAARMATLIENVLDFARGRLSGGLSLKREADVLLEPVLRHVVEELRTAWPDRAFAVDFSMTETVYCDPGRISQLLSNLLGNALAHGVRNKPIEVEARTEDGTFFLSVTNAGEPIPAKALEQLFEPFFRADFRPSQQGLGLGLYIVSEIARAHGGVINVTSRRVGNLLHLSDARTKFLIILVYLPNGCRSLILLSPRARPHDVRPSFRFAAPTARKLLARLPKAGNSDRSWGTSCRELET